MIKKLNYLRIFTETETTSSSGKINMKGRFRDEENQIKIMIL